MNDLISRQDAIDAVLKRDAGCGIDSAEVIKDLPSAQQWIPCSERLPKEDDYVLATVDYGDVTIAEYLGGNNWFTQEGNANAHTEEILAWMPLPQPWRGGDAK